MCHEFCQLAFDFGRKIRFEAVFGHRLALGRAQVKRPDLRVMMRAHTPPWSCKAGAIKTTLLYFFAARTLQAGIHSGKGHPSLHAFTQGQAWLRRGAVAIDTA